MESRVGPDGVIKQVSTFVHTYWTRLLVISAVLLLPCFWHRRLEAGDLGSHAYNAWLAQLVDRREISGLWIAHQWNNVLFDVLVSSLANIVRLPLAANIVVALSVLIFFWGLFALVSASSERAPWTLLPLIAMVCYGWTFNMGFCNYYIALALSFIALAVVWRGRRWEPILALVLTPLMLWAHPLGLMWFAGASVYILVAARAPKRGQLMAFGLAALSLVALRYTLWHHFAVSPRKHSFYLYSGLDQLLLFGPIYRVPAALCAVLLAAMLTSVWGGRKDTNLWRVGSIPLQLYVLVFLADILLPDSVRLSQYHAPLSLLSARLTSVSAALLCCLAGAMHPRKWHAIGFGAIAAIFFSLLYADTARVNRLEEQAAHLVSVLPPGQRVIATIPDQPKSRLTLEHVVDSACIYRCFNYSDYEPSTGQFRLRALPGNAIVASDFALRSEMSDGTYQAQQTELPMYQVYVCGRNGSDPRLCLRELTLDARMTAGAGAK